MSLVAARDRVSERVWEVLANVPDPEIPVVSVVDLGIVRDVVVDDGHSRVVITPTYSGCPATAVIESSIRRALESADLGDVRVETTLTPPWTTDWISDEGKRKLKAFGIAPPERRAPVQCPRCDSAEVERISEFGSTPCKALYRCRDCLEPFDRFKCH